MEEITLEKIDIIKERTGVTYTEAKEALEASNGNVIDALVYVEKILKKMEEQKNSLIPLKMNLLHGLRTLLAKVMYQG
ncbi:hypothetical protein [Clostridium sp. DMHC 10]|uniref:hypothetical protein n=1 Tax=Clostridium sp. DMHC 10 TaxID=747377 RepID=UPI000B326F30